MSVTTRTSQPAVYDDGVVRGFAVMSVIYGVVGMLVGVIIAAQLTWPALNLGIEWLSYGRLRPLHIWLLWRELHQSVSMQLSWHMR